MNLIDMGLALIEGLALIVSPCILPVLPLMLAASVNGGKRRPYGIIIGFVLAFTMFAIMARSLVALFGIDLDVIKDVSLVLLALFGLILLSSKLSDKFGVLTQGAADFGNKFISNAGEGLFSGVLIGSLIGLVWTPCAGPILAAVLVQVIRQQSNLDGYLIIISFAIGAGVPMLIIALSGRSLMNKLGFLRRHAVVVRRTFGVLIIVSVGFIASGIDVQSLFGSSNKTEDTLLTGLKLENALSSPYDAPQFADNNRWLNSPALNVQSLTGKVVLIDFWTYACINCVRTLPYLVEWDRKYRDQGLVIVGIHSPEFEFEKNPDNVKAAIAQHSIHYPVALDNNFDTWRNFDNHNWPAHYLIDRDGQVVYMHSGEGKYDEMENNIRYLLGLGKKTIIANKIDTLVAISQSPGKIFKDCSNCAKMIVIQAGSFLMGDIDNTHRVTINKRFALGQYEVTQAQWRAVMGSNPSHFKGDDLPVEMVSWNDVQAFIKKLNNKTGKEYRLPSEAEWEYACRAGGNNEYCGSDDGSSVAWYGAYADSSGNSRKTTNPVGIKKANAFGLYDMSGNVWEWVEDSLHDNYNGAPSDGSAWQGDGVKRVIRGGSWLDYALLSRATFRAWGRATKRSKDNGFRLARTLP